MRREKHVLNPPPAWMIAAQQAQAAHATISAQTVHCPGFGETRYGDDQPKKKKSTPTEVILDLI